MEAKSFFAEHDIKVNYKNISDSNNRKELMEVYGRMAVPTIIIGNKVILGFEQNKDAIAKLLNL